MHGEYKAQGEKLIVVDLETINNKISSIHISGDFFLEPDSTLEVINETLTGIDISLSVKEITELLNKSLPKETVMFGLSTNSIASAVKRTIKKANDWHDYDWRIIMDKPRDALSQVALDETLSQQLAQGKRNPTIRFWQWSEAAVVIGSFQSYKNEIIPEGLKKHNIPAVRRISGGGAMFIEPNNTITFSIYAPENLVSGLSFADSYSYLDTWVVDALNDLGIKASYKALNDIISPSGKIGGAAQKRFGSKVLLHHVTIAYDIDSEKMLEILRIGKEKISDKGITSANKRVDPIKNQCNLSRQQIINYMKEKFQNLYGGILDDVTLEEENINDEIKNKKFAQEEWLKRVP